MSGIFATRPMNGPSLSVLTARGTILEIYMLRILMVDGRR